MAPIVHGLDAEYAGKILFTYLDIDDPANDRFESALNFIGQPQFVLLDAQGGVIKTWYGRVSVEEFEAEFARALGQ